MFSSYAARILYISAFTISQALCSTLIALIIGITAAFFTSHRRFVGKSFLLSLSSVPLCIPSLLIALGFVSFFGISGTINTFFKLIFRTQTPPIRFLYSFAGIILAQGFYNFPIVMSTVHNAWIALPKEQADAARLLGASESRIFRTVTIFQLMNAISSSCILVFLYCFFSFMIVLLFGSVRCTTLEVEIYKAARGILDVKTTFILAILETTIACVIIMFYSVLEKQSASLRGLSFNYQSELEKVRGLGEKTVFIAFIVVILLFFIAPLLSIFYNAISSVQKVFTFKTIYSVVCMKGFSKALLTTIITASISSFLCIIIAFLYASFVHSIDLHENIFALRIIPMIPMAISGVVLGTIIIALVRRGNPYLLVIAQVFMIWPLAFRQIYSSISKLPEETINAAKLLSGNSIYMLFHIYLPYASKSIFSAFGFCFAASAGDTTLPLVMAIPHFDTLSLFTYRLASSYRFHEGCAAGALLAVLCSIVFFTANRLKNN